MKLLLSSIRKVPKKQWICQACLVRYVSSSSPASLSEASAKLRMNGPMRTRFAPSPTGYLHLGSMRTALFNYLVAKATGGQFLLRIEDTDQKRTVPDAEEKLFRDLNWAGIEWDEGPRVEGPYGPYKQSQRTALYREHTEKLLQSGNAYRCFCSPERLNTLAEYRTKLGEPPDYDRLCSHISKEESDDRAAQGHAHVVRLLVPQDYPVFNDLVYGLVRQRKSMTTKPRVHASALGSYDDPILLKTDGFPTYHLANVVDDHHMKISHVIRGSEWMSSTPKHLALYHAFGWTPPYFAHVGLLLDKDGQKLSKRLKSTNIAELRDSGIFPETLTNFIALLGWSHHRKTDVMDLGDLIREASLKFTKGDTVVSFEKLWFLQKKHAARYASLPLQEKPSNPAHDLNQLAVEPILELLESKAVDQPEQFSSYLGIPEISAKRNFVRLLLWNDAKSYTTPFEFIARHPYFFAAPTTEKLKETLISTKLRNVPPSITHQIAPEVLVPLMNNFAQISDSSWNVKEIKSWANSIIDHGTASSCAETKGSDNDGDLKELVSKAWMRLVYGYLRWATLAGMSGPDTSDTMIILGREESLRRLAVANELFLESQ